MAERKKFLEQALILQKQALDLRKEQQAAAGGGAAPGPADTTPPEGGTSGS
jgi:hypothetical protein